MPYCKFCEDQIEICLFCVKIWNAAYFVAKFPNTAHEAEMLEKLRPEAEENFMSAWPWDLPKDSNHHDTPSAFPYIVPGLAKEAPQVYSLF